MSKQPQPIEKIDTRGVTWKEMRFVIDKINEIISTLNPLLPDVEEGRDISDSEVAQDLKKVLDDMPHHTPVEEKVIKNGKIGDFLGYAEAPDNMVTLHTPVVEDMAEKNRFQQYLAIFIDFIEKESTRIDEERLGAYRRDGGRKMTSIVFLKDFLSKVEAFAHSEERQRIEKWVNNLKSIKIKNRMKLSKNDRYLADTIDTLVNDTKDSIIDDLLAILNEK